jgi:transposase
MKKRKQYSGAFKIKVVLEALKEEKTLAQLASENEIHATMIHAWRREFLEKAPELFEDKRKQVAQEDPQKLIGHLYKQIGQQKVELDFLKGACDKLGLKPDKDVLR